MTQQAPITSNTMLTTTTPALTPSSCPHTNFESHVEVNRTLHEGGRVAWTAMVQVRCVQCKSPFRFTGHGPVAHLPMEPG